MRGRRPAKTYTRQLEADTEMQVNEIKRELEDRREGRGLIILSQVDPNEESKIVNVVVAAERKKCKIPCGGGLVA